ncbi:MAG: type II secretion system protein GspJ, partial [Planctomycetota bacterium]|nr:type II secretion system protein GspJ [Planctomycetota bacterium]
TGFTLVEVLVASTIGSFIALVAVGSLRVIIGGAEAVDNNINAAAEVRFAANMIARDLVNFYRDKDIANTKFIGTVEDMEDEGSASYLVFYTVGRTKARVDQPEGDIYEVEYYLTKDEETSALMRRLWPNPHEEFEPGGILTVIAEDIEIFEISYFDGEEWADEWPEEIQALPHLAEITIVAKQTGSGVPPMESVTVNFVRSQGGEGAALEGGGQMQETQGNNQPSNSGASAQGDR